MKRTQRFKRSIKPKKTVKTNDQDNGADLMNLPSKSSSSIRAKIPKSPSIVSFDKSMILTPNFFQIDALDLAPRLLGKFLRRDDVVLQITEVEAYRPNDTACHGRFGVTARTAPVFGAGGHAYVYLCYGLHTMLNVVADKEGVGAAVLIRSCAPVCGLETIQQRRGQKTEKPVLLAGPGKICSPQDIELQFPKKGAVLYPEDSRSTVPEPVTSGVSIEYAMRVGQALGITTEWSNHPLYTPGGLELLDGPEPEEGILIGPRVGIEYASPEHVSALWRFAMAGSPWISVPKNTLRPS